MSIACKAIRSDRFRTEDGRRIIHSILAITGLTASGANTVPHGLPRAPNSIDLQAVGNGAIGVVVSLDDSQGGADPTGTLGGMKLGFDATNIYLYIGNCTECIADVWYGVS